MNNNWERCKTLISLVILAYILVACASSAPATKFYSLFPDEKIERVEFNKTNISLGIGPVVLPEYLENPAVVSIDNSQQVRVSGYHAWAGDLKAAMLRVMANNISTSLNHSVVWAFPWDNRVRPDYQIRIVFDEFSGVRGGKLSLRAKWTLLNKKADKILLMGSEHLTANTEDSSVDSYVATLNQLLNRFSEKVAQELAGDL